MSFLCVIKDIITYRKQWSEGQVQGAKRHDGLLAETSQDLRDA